MMDEPTWPSYRFRAMGSTMVLWLDTDEATARPVLSRVQGLVAAAERVLSRFDPQSELARFNARPRQWVPVSPLLWDVVTQALALAEATGGLFDPTILSALEAAGYRRSFAGMHGVAQDSASEATPGCWATVQRDPTRRALWLPEGARLDLGGIAKGYTAQRTVAYLSRWGPCLVDAGGDLTAGAAPPGLPGWPVAVAAPAAGDDESSDLFHLWLAQATLATSGIDYRRWQHNGRLVHHLIDPRTGHPAATDALAVSVLAPDAAQAEGWATAALVAGRDEGLALLSRQGLAGAVVDWQHQLRLTPAMAPRMVRPAVS
jgi:thiamine biosynthesis lipoprotein